MNMTRVFVYGTLKAGHPNHRLLAGSTMLGRQVLEGFKMVSLGAFPGAVMCPKVEEWGKIYGEVYEITEDTLHALDLLEGHPTFYERVKVATEWKNAWIYTLSDDYLKDHQLVDDGVWKPTAEELAYVRSAGG